MAILLVLILVTWYFTELILFVWEILYLVFSPNHSVRAKLFSIVVVLIAAFYLYFYSPFTLTLEYPAVYNQGGEEPIIPNNDKGTNPFEIRLFSPLMDKSVSFDVRNVSDVFMITAIGKLGLAAMNTVSTPKAKAVIGVSTTLSLGTIGAGYKLMNQARNNLRYLNDSVNNNSNNNPSSSSDNNFTSNSPLENLSSSESLVWVLFCIKLLVVIVLLLIILIIFINWALNKLNSLNNSDNGYPHYFKFLSKENNDLLIRKAQLFWGKSGNITIKLLILLVCINLISAIYFINEVMSFISLLNF